MGSVFAIVLILFGTAGQVSVIVNESRYQSMQACENARYKLLENLDRRGLNNPAIVKNYISYCTNELRSA